MSKVSFSIRKLGLLVGFSVLLSCNNGTVKTDTDHIYIVTTTGMIGDALENIVKDKAKVETLMGPGIDPHLYKATQSDLTKLNEADIVFYNGVFLEGKMEDILEKLGKSKKTVALGAHVDQSKLIKVSHAGNGALSFDPHIWFDVFLWSEAVKAAGKAMEEFDQPNAEFYRKNTEDYLAQLIELDNWVKTETALIPETQRVLVTSHDAFHYFGKAYKVEVEGLQGISTASDFGLQDVTRLVDKIINQNVKAVFIETSVSSRSLTAVVEGCNEKGYAVKIGGTLFSDAMGQKGTPEGTYIGMVKANVNTVVAALK